MKDEKGRMVSIQKFLQDAYLSMSEVVVKAVGDLDAVLGFEVRHDMTCLVVVLIAALADDERATQRVYWRKIPALVRLQCQSSFVLYA